MIPIILFLFGFLFFLIPFFLGFQSVNKTGGAIDNINFLYEKCKLLFINKTFKPICRYNELKTIKYDDYANVRLGCHMGQRKLLLSELQFYSDYDNDLIVYAGSAPCIHLTMILDMFPNMKFKPGLIPTFKVSAIAT